MLQLQLFFVLVPPALVASGIWLAWFLQRGEIQKTWDRFVIIERRGPEHPKLRGCPSLGTGATEFPQLRLAKRNGFFNRGKGFEEADGVTVTVLRYGRSIQPGAHGSTLDAP